MPQLTARQGEKKLSFEASAGERLLDALRRAGLELDTPCGGKGTCHKCGVEIEGQGMVLACRYHVEHDIELRLPAAGKHLILESREAELKPVKLQSGLSIARAGAGRVVSYEGKKLASQPDGGDTGKPSLLGIAVDIGTTTVVVYLEDLAAYALVDAASFLNPQSQHGSDVISRIHHVIEDPSGLDRLKSLIIGGINSAIEELCSRNTLEPGNLYKATVVGNTTMLHLLCGVNPSSIAFAPFMPAFVEAKTLTSKEIGLSANRAAVVKILPSISGYVGADVMAGIAATPIPQSDSLSLYIDIGTNGEMAIGNRERILCCSTAAGPAFEGARIRCGTGGIEGAINHYSAGTYSTIGGGAPVGICGSGLVDIVATLVRDSVIDMSGYMEKDFVVERKDRTASGRDIVLAPSDVREVQLAKAAIRAGIEILMKEAAASYSSVERVYLAGAFGNYMNVDSAAAIGLLPAALAGKVVQAGNSAGKGARLALRSLEFEEEVRRLVECSSYIELSMRGDFNDAYVNAMMFGGD